MPGCVLLTARTARWAIIVRMFCFPTRINSYGASTDFEKNQLLGLHSQRYPTFFLKKTFGQVPKAQWSAIAVGAVVGAPRIVLRSTKKDI